MTKKIPALAAVLVLALALAVPVAAQTANTLKAVTFQRTAAGINIALAIEGEILFQAHALSNPARLAVDLSPLSKIEAPAFIAVDQAGVAGIRTGQFSAMIARVVIDFTGDLPSYEIAKTDAGLVVRFSTEAKPAARIAAPAPQQPTREQPVAAAKTEEPPVESEGGEVREGFANTMFGLSYGSYQIPAERFKEVYGPDTTMTFGLSLSRTLVQTGGLSLDVEGGIRFYSKTGAATLSQDAATFKMTPISLSGLLNYQVKFFQVFVGYGLDWYSFTETSDVMTTTGNANGHHFTAGVYLIPPVLDGLLRLKAYYKFTKVTASANGFDVDLGGNEYGIGLSFGFNLFNKGIFSF